MLKKMAVPIITGVATSPKLTSAAHTDKSETGTDLEIDDENQPHCQEEAEDGEKTDPVKATTAQLIDFKIDSDGNSDGSYAEITNGDSGPVIAPDISIVVTESPNEAVKAHSDANVQDMQSGTGVIAALRAVETMPCTSYSSSDDDDDDDDDDAEFFDANEFNEISGEESTEHTIAERYLGLWFLCFGLLVKYL